MKNFTLFVSETDKEYRVVVGKDRYENSEMIKNSYPEDLWFHLENISGPHIILQSNGDVIHKRYLTQVARMFREHKTNLACKYTVIYTEVKNVQLTKTPGQVIPRKIRFIRV